MPLHIWHAMTHAEAFSTRSHHRPLPFRLAAFDFGQDFEFEKVALEGHLGWWDELARSQHHAAVVFEETWGVQVLASPPKR
jgi:hypothetical protein